MIMQDFLAQIRSFGMTDKAIGDAVLAPQSTITRLRNGVHKSTSFERGKAIQSLFNKLNGEQHG